MMAGARRWDDLLADSNRLVADGPGVDPQFPSLERNLEQLEQLSRQLKARAGRYDTSSNDTAATRLLAREGFDADRLTRELRSIELQTTFEDVFPVEATSVEEYLQQVHEVTVLAAIQEAQHEAQRSFDDFMVQTSQTAWKKQKQDFLQSLSRAPAIAPASATSSPALLANRPFADPRPLSQVGPGALVVAPSGDPSAGQSVAEKKASAYASAVHTLNASRDSRQELKMATTFKGAYVNAVGEDKKGRSVDMLRIWELVQSLLREDAGRAAGGGPPVAAMVAGARSHLEAGHAQYILDVINSHPAQAALGGSPGRLNRVHAFLRVRLRGQGALDFDRGANKGPGIDTTWQQIYFCLRSGYYEEAKAVARSSPASKDFAPKLAEWVDRGGRVLDDVAAKVAEECERMAREVGRQGRPGYDKRKMLLYCIVSGSKEAGERLLRDIPVLFSTIEDFMWFKLAMLREAEASSSDAPGSSLEALQAYLQQYPPSYYTKNGKEPLVYPYVLLLSLQLHSAVVHLYKDPATEPFRVDALHLAIVLGSQGAFTAVPGPPSRNGGPPETVSEVAALIRSYGGQYLQRGQAHVALEYYLAAALTAGGGGATEFPQARDRMLTSCLREMLHTPSGMNLLLGNWGVGQREGVLGRLVSEEAAQRRLVLSAARDCLDTAQYEEATELFKRAEAFASALEIVTRRLSESMSRGEQEGDARAAAVSNRGGEIIEAARAFGTGASAQEREQFTQQEAAFNHLTTLLAFFRHARAGKPAEALRELASLPYLPFNDRPVEQCVHALQGAPRVVEDRLQDAVRLLPGLLDRLTDTDGSVRQLQVKLANFVAHTGQRNWSQATVDSIATMPMGYATSRR